MSMIETITLPVVAATETVGDALRKLRKMGTSAVVAIDKSGKSGPVVLTDQSLRIARVTKGPDTPISDVSRLAFPLESDAAAVGAFRRLLAKLPGVSEPVHRTVLAAEQDNYVVKTFDDATATVATPSSYAIRLESPSALFDKSEIPL